MPRPIAIVAAMRSELAPLLASARARRVQGIQVFELPSALVAIGGIGRKVAAQAAEIVVEEANPKLLVSAGFAGALTPGLEAGEVVHVGDIIDEVTGEHCSTGAGNAVLVSATRVTGIEAKKRLAAMFAASAVDLEGAAVAQVAKQHGIAFAAVKAISDELEFPMPPFNSFVDERGQLQTGKFTAFVAVRPRWWGPVLRLARNSAMASKNLSIALEHLMGEYVKSLQSEDLNPGFTPGKLCR